MSRNLKSKIPGAPNFTYGEFVKSDTALRKGIDNTPSEAEWECIEKLAVNILQPVRNQFGSLRITSGYRSVALCIAIGSSSASNHTRGQAADFEPNDPNIKLIDMLSWIHDNLEYRELIAEYFPNGWIHATYREDGNNKTLKLKDTTHSYTAVSLPYIRGIYN